MCILTLLATSQFAFGATILIPTTYFDPFTYLEDYFAYLYPWGSDHNGLAQMVGNSSAMSTSRFYHYHKARQWSTSH